MHQVFTRMVVAFEPYGLVRVLSREEGVHRY